jgi:hypothetical protein
MWHCFYSWVQTTSLDWLCTFSLVAGRADDTFHDHTNKSTFNLSHTQLSTKWVKQSWELLYEREFDKVCCTESHIGIYKYFGCTENCIYLRACSQQEFMKHSSYKHCNMSWMNFRFVKANMQQRHKERVAAFLDVNSYPECTHITLAFTPRETPPLLTINIYV